MYEVRHFEYRQDDARVRALQALCHPTWPEFPAVWYCAHPTLVVEAEGELVAFTSYAMNFTDEGKLTMWGKDTCVAPEWRGRGIASDLLQRRLNIARQLGAGIFVGATALDNVPMQRLLEKAGGTVQGLIHGAYPDGTNALCYIIEVK
jgi:GNAT superfamily N-acetyltransferase